jgi:hypothetical protein
MTAGVGSAPWAAPRRRDRAPRWPLLVAATCLSILAIGGAKHLLYSQNGCPSGTTYEDTSIVTVCNAPSGRVVCQMGTYNGAWSWTPCPGVKR